VVVVVVVGSDEVVVVVVIGSEVVVVVVVVLLLLLLEVVVVTSPQGYSEIISTDPIVVVNPLPSVHILKVPVNVFVEKVPSQLNHSIEELSAANKS
jgi:hypothetical protein